MTVSTERPARTEVLRKAASGTQLRCEPYVIEGVDVGPENPLPYFRAQESYKPKLDPSIPEEDGRYMGWHCGYRVLPYRMQDGYNRKRYTRRFNGIVLENECLRATFLPEAGGRLVSLFHKVQNRELLDRNPIFQLANLSQRNAWFSGGIEWNTSHFGHTYLTASPLFAARIQGPDGSPGLRLYEWDRVRCFPFQIDFYLPPGSPFLFSHPRLINPHETELPMYWWTNAAVCESPDVRMLCPAEKAFTWNKKGASCLATMPQLHTHDVSYSTRAAQSGECFMYIPKGQRPWIAGLDAKGTGYVHASTAQLKGRKMFYFGRGAGGRRWQQFLADHGQAYIELQAGLARTQQQHLPMPPLSQWQWTEAFGLLAADAQQVHDADWNTAWRAADAALNTALPQSQLEALDRQFTALSSQKATELFARGSAWGALERRRLAVQKQPDHIPPELEFPESDLGPEQAPWLQLLEQGALPEIDPQTDPMQGMVQPEWAALIEQSIENGKGDHWVSWLHLGNARAEALKKNAAHRAWDTSIKRRPNAWAMRNHAGLMRARGLTRLLTLRRDKRRDLEACKQLRTAWETGPALTPLAMEYAALLMETKQLATFQQFVDSLPDSIKQHERFRIYTAQAAMEAGRLDEAMAIFQQEIAGIREGEVTLTDMWFRLHEQRLAAQLGVTVSAELRERVRREFPPPANIDFRMHTEPAEEKKKKK